MCINGNKAFLYQSGKGVKVLLLGFEDKMFNVDSPLPSPSFPPLTIV